jgi:uncharacterized protein (TIGR02594 family)
VLSFRQSLRVIALTLCSAAVAAVSTTPASARPHHGAGHHVHAGHVSHHVRRHVRHHHRSLARHSRWQRGVAQLQSGGFDDTQASLASGAASGSLDSASGMAMSGGYGETAGVVAEARRYLGGNPTSRRSLWCARFMNMVLERTGHRGTGSDLARSFASYGQRVSGPQVGAIAVMGRRGGGHVGVVSGVDAQGNPIVISGNSSRRVREASVSRGRIYAYVLPN